MARQPWIIETDSRGEIVVDAVVGGWQQFARGDEMSMSLRFYSDLDLPTGGWQYDGDLYDSNLYTNTFSVGSATRRYRQTRQYQDFAGSYASGLTAANRPWYREQLPSGAVPSSQLIALRPQDTSLQTTHEGLWALVADVVDETPPTDFPYRLEVSLLVLAEYGEYGDHTAVRAAFEA